MVLELESAQQKVKAALDHFNSANRERYRALEETHSTYEGLKQLRIQTLENILTEKGLSICSDSAYSHNGDSEEEKLGIFPSSQLRYHYRAYNYWGGGCSSADYRDRATTLERLCPQHFPQNPNHVSPGYENEQLNIHSEVIEQDGKLITVINQIDVTDLKVHTYYDEGIFSHFGLPKLPEQPRW